MVSSGPNQNKVLINTSISVTWFLHTKLTGEWLKLSRAYSTAQHRKPQELTLVYRSLLHSDLLLAEITISFTEELQDRKTVTKYPCKTFRYLFLLHTKEQLGWSVYVGAHTQTEPVAQGKGKKKYDQQTCLCSRPIHGNMVSQEQRKKASFAQRPAEQEKSEHTISSLCFPFLPAQMFDLPESSLSPFNLLQINRFLSWPRLLESCFLFNPHKGYIVLTCLLP